MFTHDGRMKTSKVIRLPSTNGLFPQQAFVSVVLPGKCYSPAAKLVSPATLLEESGARNGAKL